jgi:aspartate aminotransferase
MAAALRPPSRGSAPVAAASAPAAGVSALAGVPQAPPDPVLGITDAFRRDESPDKLNLGVGAYRTEAGAPYVLEVVRAAEAAMLAANENKEYLPIEGLPAFCVATAQLLLGADAPALAERRVATLQALSGTGALAVAAHFLHEYAPGATVYISDPSWPNHKNIFSLAGVPWATYRYWDPAAAGLDVGGLLADLRAAPAGSVVLLHGCAHNPTGCDPTKAQWAQIADVVEERGHLPFFDVAYQGFATGSLEEDSYAPRYFASRGLELLVAQSYSKNLGLYSERVGALSAVCADAERAGKVLSQFKRFARATWSNPPAHGARIVAAVVSDASMFAAWKKEMEAMSGRIMGVRKALRAALERLDASRDWAFVTTQIGMFSYTGLTPVQVENMTAKWHIYMTKDGRISLAGLSLSKCEYVAQAIVDSLKC